MEYNYPKFTPEMKKTHTILIPNMAITQFRLLEYALRYDGYKCEILGNCGSAVAQLGLKYVHNDTCYPALLVIGQFLDALNSGKYDLDHTALLITQTGGGCRASNYIHLLRKALVKAGYPNIPVASLNFSGLEKDSGFQMTLPLARRAIASVFYGDMLCALRNQVAPYENEKGAADKMVDLWVQRLGRVMLAGKGFTSREMKHTFPLIAKDFAAIPVTRVPKVKVGVVGEIYVKYSPLGNNDLQKFLESQDCEVNFPGLMGFVQYCIFNMGEDHVLYGGKLAMKMGTDQLLNWLDGVERKYVEEVGSMNIMFKVDGEIYTAPTVGTVLPGITRMSCIELLKKWGYKVHEERFTIDFIMDAAKTGKLEEVFGTGTAAVISPVGGLTYEGDSEVINNGEIGEVTQKLYDTLTGIQFGKQADDMGWIVPVE